MFWMTIFRPMLLGNGAQHHAESQSILIPEYQAVSTDACLPTRVMIPTVPSQPLCWYRSACLIRPHLSCLSDTISRQLCVLLNSISAARQQPVSFHQTTMGVHCVCTPRCYSASCRQFKAFEAIKASSCCSALAHIARLPSLLQIILT